MKRSYGTGSLVFRGRNWFIRYRRNGHIITHKIIDPETGNTPETKSHAARLATVIMGESIQNIDLVLQRLKHKGITLQQIIHDYLANLKPEVSDKWFDTQKCYFSNRILPYFGEDARICEIDAIWIGKFRETLLQRKIQNKTINSILGSLSKLLKYAARIGVILSIPFIARLPLQEKEIGRRLSLGDLERLFEAAEAEGLHAVLFLGFARYCGARRSEAQRIQWEWIDWDKKLIRLDRQKNKTAMPIPLPVPMIRLLERVPPKKRSGVVVLWKGQPYREGRELWDRIKAAAGIDRTIRYHDLRHTFCCEVFDKYGFAGKELTRHSGTEAYRRYLHFEREKLIAQASQELFRE